MQALCHPTLFIAIALISGVLISSVFSYFESNEKKLDGKLINVILFGLWSIGIIVFVMLVLLIFSGKPGEREIVVAFAPIGILLAAFIASASVMKSIKNQNDIEDYKDYRELHKDRKEIATAISAIDIDAISDHIHLLQSRESVKELKSIKAKAEPLFPSQVILKIDNVYKEAKKIVDYYDQYSTLKIRTPNKGNLLKAHNDLKSSLEKYIKYQER